MTLDDMDDIMEQGESMDGLEVGPSVNVPPSSPPRPDMSRAQGDGAAMQLDFDDDEDFGGDDSDLYGDFEL